MGIETRVFQVPWSGHIDELPVGNSLKQIIDASAIITAAADSWVSDSTKDGNKAVYLQTNLWSIDIPSMKVNIEVTADVEFLNTIQSFY